MLRKSTVTLTLFLCLAWTSIFAAAPTSAEIELTNLLNKADIGFNLGNRLQTADYVSQAETVLIRNPDVNYNLQGHFYKLKGKMEIGNSLDAAVCNFNKAMAYFSANRSEQASVQLFIGITYYYANDYNTAETYFNAANDFFTANKDKINTAQSLNNLAVVAFMKGDAQNANELCSQALFINVEIENTLNAMKNQQNIGFFTGRMSLSLDDIFEKSTDNEKPLRKDGNGGGSPPEVTTNGGGTVVVGSGGH